jgi:hypothetical protein
MPDRFIKPPPGCGPNRLGLLIVLMILLLAGMESKLSTKCIYF